MTADGDEVGSLFLFKGLSASEQIAADCTVRSPQESHMDVSPSLPARLCIGLAYLGAMEAISVDCDLILKVVCSQMY